MQDRKGVSEKWGELMEKMEKDDKLAGVLESLDALGIAIDGSSERQRLRVPYSDAKPLVRDAQWK